MSLMIAIGDRWTLSRLQREQAIWLGTERDRADREAGIIDRKKSSKLTSLEINIDGAGLEIAGAFHMGVDPDMDTRALIHRWKDMTTLDGVPIDWKDTRYFTGKLIVDVEKARKNEGLVYALGIGAFPCYKFVGFLGATALRAKNQIINYGKGDNYYATQSQLIPDYRKA